MKSSSLEDLTLRYIDEESASLLQQNTLNSYPIMPQNEINFEDIFQIDQSEVGTQKTKSRFFNQNNLKVNKEEKQQLTIYLQQNLGNIKARRKTIHHIPPAHLMRSIKNVSIPNNFGQLISFFLKSKYFTYLITLAAILNVVGIFLIDYSFRIEAQLPYRLSKMNTISLALQMVANWVFTFEICMKIYKSDGNMKQPYLIVNMLGTFATWATIFFDMMQQDKNLIFRIMVIIRIVRAIIRIIEVTSWLRQPFQIFIKTIPSLQKLFFPYLIIALFYAITGMALFYDSIHHICVGDPQSSQIYGNFCGSSMYHCHEGQTCQYVQQLPEGTLHNQYNLIRFDNIGNALLTVYHFVFISNFHVIRSKFAYFINPYITSVYFVSMSIFFFYIFANLVMISMSKAYMEQVDHHKIKKDSQVIQESREQQRRPCELIQKILNLLNFLLAIVQTIVLALTYEGISQKNQKLQYLMDFILSWVSLFVVILLIFFQKRHFFKDPLNIIDLITLLFHFLSLIICLIKQQSVIFSLTTSSQILRSIKALRIIRLIYFKENLFRYQKYVIRVFLQTIFKVKSFLMLCVCFALMFKLLGELFFAYVIRFTQDGKVDIQNGQAYAQNFQSFSSSLYTVFYLFLNERWSEIMYLYYAAAGPVAIWYFVIIVFFSHMMLIRLYIAVFLSYFKEELHKKSKQETIRQKSSKIQQSREMVRKITVQPLEHEQSSKKSQKHQIKDQQEQQRTQNKVYKWPLVQVLYHSNRFSIFINTTILVHCLTIILRNTHNQKQNLILDIEIICYSIYIMEVLIGCLVQGVSCKSQNYFGKNKSNFISLIVAVLAVLSFIPFGLELVTLYLRRLTIIKVFTFFRQTDKEMSIVLDTIFNIIRKFLNFLIIYTLLLCVIALIPLKLLHNYPYLFDCKASPFYHGQHPHNEAECLAAGGNWFQNQHFSNIFTSVALMYEIVSSQSWTIFIQDLISGNKVFGWQIFFILIFFVYNICFLGIVMGFIVQTYLHLKDKAYNLNLLKPSQKCWILIKNSINCLKPKTVINLPQGATSQRKLIFQLVTNESYMSIMDYLPYCNAVLTVLLYNQNPYLESRITYYFRDAVLFIFNCDTVLKLFAHRRNFCQLNNSYIELVSSIFIVVYCVANQTSNLGQEVKNILDGLLTALLLLRCKSLLLKYAWCKTHLNSIIDILPKCAKIIKLVCVVLFFYAAIGLQLFKNLDQNHLIDNYSFGFDDFLTAILTLVKVIISQSWFEIVSGFIQHSNTSHLCHNMFDYEYLKVNGPHACGSWVAYPYFLSFHVLMVLLVMNLLIATMASAYDDNYQIQYNSVNIFQLQECLSLWQKYDPMATGVVQYKKFWRLTSEIAILFGISKKKLIKRKNKFFEELDLQIYQSVDSPMLCYRFHDVITKFSKIKLQVANLGHNQNPPQNGDNQLQIEFDINPIILKEIQDYVTPFPDHLYTSFKPFKSYKSGQTKHIFGLLKKIRHWKHIATEKKRPRGGAKLSSIFQLASKKSHNLDMEQSEQLGIKQL